jgi:heme exporter protein D
MFPGLTALGSYVFYIVIAVTCMVGCIIFNIVRIVKKRRGERAVKPEEERNVEPDEAQNTKPIKLKITDFLNLAIVAAAIILLSYFIVSFGIYEIHNQMNQHVISQNDDYRTQVLTELIESEEYEKAMWRGVNEDGTIERENGEQDVPLFDEAEYELCWEAYTYSLFVETMAKDESIKASDCKNVGVSKIFAEVLEQGKNDYISFTKRYVPEGGVAMEGQNIVYDADKKTVSVSSGLQCIDQSENCTVDACMVVVFDKNWKVTDIYCQDRELEQVNQY